MVNEFQRKTRKKIHFSELKKLIFWHIKKTLAHIRLETDKQTEKKNIHIAIETDKQTEKKYLQTIKKQTNKLKTNTYSKPNIKRILCF